jgi:hypothetical protein
MAYQQKLADRIREKLADLPLIEEKVMFRGLCFMVNGKMCISVGKEEIMCRIDPDKYEQAIEMEGCRPMIHAGKTIRGFVFVDQGVLHTDKRLGFWIDLCLEYNERAKPSKAKVKNNAKKRKI